MTRDAESGAQNEGTSDDTEQVQLFGPGTP